MIDRFNFYDIFGYFIPGCVLLLAAGLPIGIVRDSWPSTDLASAVVAIVIAYLLGHFVQYIAKRALPSTKSGRVRSVAMLDKAATILGRSLQEQATSTIKAQLGLDMDKGDEDQDVVDDRRGAAFFAAREQLVAGARARYVEQFQALYSMMRGNCAASALGAAHCIGWIAAAPQFEHTAFWVTSIAALALPVTLLVPDSEARTSRERRLADQRAGRRSAAILVVIAIGAGMLAGTSLRDDGTHQLGVFALFAAFVVLTIQSWRSYQSYADEFAKAVYRGFVQIHKHPVPKNPD